MVKVEKYVNTSVPIEKELRLLFDNEEELTLFDIGACEGLDSIRYAKLFSKAKIYAFEPLPSKI